MFRNRRTSKTSSETVAWRVAWSQCSTWSGSGRGATCDKLVIWSLWWVVFQTLCIMESFGWWLFAGFLDAVDLGHIWQKQYTEESVGWLFTRKQHVVSKPNRVIIYFTVCIQWLEIVIVFTQDGKSMRRGKQKN